MLQTRDSQIPEKLKQFPGSHLVADGALSQVAHPAKPGDPPCLPHQQATALQRGLQSGMFHHRVDDGGIDLDPHEVFTCTGPGNPGRADQLL
jgi:hypothetical protein